MDTMTSRAAGREQAMAALMHGSLDKQKDGQRIAHVLAQLGAYYDADGVCLLELDEARTRIGSVRAWQRAGVCAQEGSWQRVPQEALARWLELLAQRGELFASAGDGADSPARRILALRGVANLMAAPIAAGGEIIGFLCVDAPRRDTGDLLLLSVAAAACCGEMAARRMAQARLRSAEEEKKHSAIISAMSNVFLCCAISIWMTTPLRSSSRPMRRRTGPARRRTPVRRCGA